MYTFNPATFFIPETTLATELNHVFGDIFSHNVRERKNLRWYQFGRVSLLKNRENPEFSPSFSVVTFKAFNGKLMYDLAIYHGYVADELKAFLDAGERLPEGHYEQFTNPYDLALCVLDRLGAKTPPPKADDEDEEGYW